MAEQMYNTGNPVPSVDPKDRHDNSLVLDNVMTGDAKSYVNRQGKQVYSIDWMQTAATGVPAVEAAIRAEEARDSVMLSSGLFDTVALGLAGTPVGKYFSVPSASNDSFINLYKNVAGSAQLIDTYPNSKAIERVMTTDSSDVAHFTDENGFSLDVWISKDELGAKRVAVGGVAIEESGGNGLYVVDENGFMIQSLSELGAGPATSAIPARLDNQKRAGVMHFLIDGQSLSRGAYSVPAISLTQPYSNIMLASGVLVRAGEAGYNPTAFVPLVESVVGGEGETPTSGMLNELVRRIAVSGAPSSDWVFCGNSVGQGGAKIGELSKGGSAGTFEKSLQLIRDTKKLCDSQGKTYNVWGHYWLQGEGDYSINSPDYIGEYYEQTLAKRYNDLNSEIVSITGQDFIPYVFTYQCANNRGAGRNHMNVAMAQWRISRSNPNFCLAAPAYIAPVVEDYLHLTNEASWMMGAYAARASHLTMYRRSGKWRPLEPVNVVWTDTYVDIEFHVPCGPLVLDSLLAAATPNSGFDIWSGETVLNIVSSVSINGPKTVRLALSSPAPSGAMLSYALGRPGDPQQAGPEIGPRGNLRDSHGLYDIATSPAGVAHPLHNACVQFTYNRQFGF